MHVGFKTKVCICFLASGAAADGELSACRPVSGPLSQPDKPQRLTTNLSVAAGRPGKGCGGAWACRRLRGKCGCERTGMRRLVANRLPMRTATPATASARRTWRERGGIQAKASGAKLSLSQRPPGRSGVHVQHEARHGRAEDDDEDGREDEEYERKQQFDGGLGGPFLRLLAPLDTQGLGVDAQR